MYMQIKPHLIRLYKSSWFTLQNSDYDVIMDFGVDSTSLRLSFKKYNVMFS